MKQEQDCRESACNGGVSERDSSKEEEERARADRSGEGIYYAISVSFKR